MFRALPSALLVTLLAATSVRAQSPGDEVHDGVPSWVRVRSGVTLRSGRSLSNAGGLAYDGRTAADFGVATRVGFARHWVLRADLEREAFGLDSAATRLSSGSLFRGNLLAGYVFGDRSTWFEINAGYGLAQLPFLGTAEAPSFDAGTRHALVAGGRAGFAIASPLVLELGLAAPFRLSSASPRGEFASAGVAFDAWLTYSFVNLGQKRLGAALGYTLLSDRYKVGDEPASTQKLSRIGLALVFSWGGMGGPPPASVDPQPAAASTRVARASNSTGDFGDEPDAAVDGSTRTGKLSLRILDAESRSAVASANVEIPTGEGMKRRSSGADGRVNFDSLPLGEALAKVSAAGYVNTDVEISIRLENAGEQEVLLKKPAQKRPTRKTGDLSLVVLDARSGKPLPAASVTVRGDEYFSGPKGDLMLVDLASGNLELRVSASGYRPMRETVRIVPGENTEIRVQLQRARR